MNDAPTKWNAEYQSAGIPSSFRTAPSFAARFFLSYLNLKHIPRGVLLDIGCGAGRNTLFFGQAGFETIAVDFSQAALDKLAAKVAEQDLKVPPVVHHHDITADWTFIRTGGANFAIDIFVFVHLNDSAKRLHHRAELLRSLTVGGYFMIQVAGLNDGYYGVGGQCKHLNSGLEKDGEMIHACDEKGGGIDIILHSLASLERFFLEAGVQGKRLVLAHSETQYNVSSMYGVDYKREQHLLIFRVV